MQAANTLGKYHIIRELARSNDIVYEAMDPSRGRRIALKELQIPPNLTGQARQDRIQRFTREARAAARLQHTNIVRIHEHGHVQGRYFIAMEFLEGQSLRDVLRQRGAMPLQEALRIAACVADGLEFAHKNGVVHRDVKPDNVHLEPDGRVVITDFGIARLTFEPTLTAAGQIFGTPSYMSPEQVTGKDIDRRSDVFSLGVMLYEMVAGRKPFTGDSVITITYNIMNMEAPPLPGAPPGLDNVIRKAMAKEPGRRYQSAAEMAEDIRLIQQGKPPRRAMAASAPPPPPPPSAARPSHSAPVSTPASRGYSSSPPPQSGPAAPPPYTPMPSAPVPGARPMGAPLPPPNYGNGPRASVPNPMPPPGYPAAASAPPMQGGAAPHIPLHARPAPRKQGGFDTKWFLGWIGVAVVVAALVLMLVWVSVNAYDKFQQNTGLVATERQRQSAEAAFNAGNFEEAATLYAASAENSQGERRRIGFLNAATAAARLAQQLLDAKRPDPSAGETAARRAIQYNRDSAVGYQLLGRALAMQGRVDEAMPQFDESVAAAERVGRSEPNQKERQVQQKAGADAYLWKADALYRDGVKLMNSNPEIARRRFEEVLRVAPRSSFGRNAEIHLQSLQAQQSSGANLPAPDPLSSGASSASSTPSTSAAPAPAGSASAPAASPLPRSAPAQPRYPALPGTPVRPPGWEDVRFNPSGQP